ncbi:MAG TPA: hypothetical protein VIZ43_16830 [Trebonia sp.]
MAKTSGLGATIIVDDATGTPQTISNDFTEFSFSTPRGVQDVTGVDKSAHERLLLLADYSNSLKGVFNAAPNMSHAVFSTVPSTSVNRTTKIEPTAGGTPFLAAEVLYSDYAISRSASGELTFDATGALADGTVPTWS